MSRKVQTSSEDSNICIKFHPKFPSGFIFGLVQLKKKVGFLLVIGRLADISLKWILVGTKIDKFPFEKCWLTA